MLIGAFVRAWAKWAAIGIFAVSVLLGLASAAYGYLWAIHPLALALVVVMMATIGGVIAFVVALIGYAAFPPPAGKTPPKS